MKTDLHRLFRRDDSADISSATSYRIELPVDLHGELLRLANNSELSLEIIFIAALKVLLHEYKSSSFKMHLVDVRARVLRAYVLGCRPFALNVNGTEISFSLSNAYDAAGVAGNLISILKLVTGNVDVAIDDVLANELSRGVARNTAGRVTHRVFEEQARKTPNRIAVSRGDESLTYAELNALANRLARSLQRRGVKPETIVSVLMRRGPSLLTAMLALFKCGGVYLPLDPHQPPARLAQIASDSKSALVLAAKEFRGVVQAPVVFIEDLLAEDESEENFDDAIDETNLAYVIYTSGSTGAPKGAMLEHRGLFNHLDAKVDDLDLCATDVVAQTASQSFDVSVWQFLAALLTGGQVRIISDDVVKEPSQLLNEVTRESVSVLEVVPSQLRALLTTIDLNGVPDLSSLRFLLVTGEALPPELCRQWLELFPSTPLVNAYGPTECSDDVTHHFINQPLMHADTTPIGRPIQNMHVYVLGSGLRPVPCGTPGEIYVGGIGVGRGYLHDAGRTAEVYVPDPFSREPGARLYYTGDIGCYLPDGNVLFNGRRDHQVKIRGFRIELGEIEAALRAHPAVNDAVVLAFDDGPGGSSRLVAYAAGAEVAKKELRQFVRGRLPEHMVPSELIMLERLPLNRNGKIDRKALPHPEPIDRSEDDDFLPPLTDVEKTLAAIWARNLRVAHVSLSDNFFDLGGDSLLSIQVLNQIRSELNIDLAMKSLLEAATLGELADRVNELLPAEITDQCQTNATAFATQR